MDIFLELQSYKLKVEYFTLSLENDFQVAVNYLLTVISFLHPYLLAGLNSVRTFRNFPDRLFLLK